MSSKKVLTYLWDKAQVTQSDQDSMTGEDIASKIAALDINQVLRDLDIAEINPAASQGSVDGAVAMASWFQVCFQQAVGAKQLLQDFLSKRRVLSRLLPPSFAAAVELIGASSREHINVWDTLQQLSDGFVLREFASLPANLPDIIYAKKFDITILALMGFVVVDDGRYSLVAYSTDDEDWVHVLGSLWRRMHVTLARP